MNALSPFPLTPVEQRNALADQLAVLTVGLRGLMSTDAPDHVAALRGLVEAADRALVLARQAADRELVLEMQTALSLRGISLAGLLESGAGADDQVH